MSTRPRTRQLRVPDHGRASVAPRSPEILWTRFEGFRNYEHYFLLWGKPISSVFMAASYAASIFSLRLFSGKPRSSSLISCDLFPERTVSGGGLYVGTSCKKMRPTPRPPKVPKKISVGPESFKSRATGTSVAPWNRANAKVHRDPNGDIHFRRRKDTTTSDRRRVFSSVVPVLFF